MADTAPDIGDAGTVPEWVPELRAGVRADVYPVSPPDRVGGPLQAELVLDRDSVTAGYAERRPPYEFSSHLEAETITPEALAKIRAAVSRLRRARPAALQRQVLPASLDAADGGPASSRKSQFPMQKPSAKSTLEDWFNKLASGGAFSTAALSKAVPLGPAIVRAVGKVLEMMSTRAVPTQRAVWYVRIAVLNECVKQIRPDRAAPTPRVFWTRQLCLLLKSEVDNMRAKKHPPNREEFWEYVLDLARWQADEALLDVDSWLERIVSCVRSDVGHGGGLGQGAAGRVALRAAEIFLDDFRANRASAQQLTEALLAAIDMVGGPEAAAKSSGVVAAGPVGTSSSIQREKRSPVSRVAYLLCVLLDHADHRPALLQKTISGNTDVVSPEDLAELVTIAKSAVSLTGPRLQQRDPLCEAGNESAEVPQNAIMGPHSVSRLLERLPSSGDVVSLRDALLTVFDAQDRGGSRGAVTFLCTWAVRGPMRNSALAVVIASTMIVALARHALSRQGEHGTDDLGQAIKRGSATRGNGKLPTFQNEIWHFVKHLDAFRLNDVANQIQVPTQDEYGYHVDPKLAEAEDSHVTELLTLLYRVGEFSLASYMNEVSRLVCTGSQTCSRHLLYIAALPEPRDPSAADARRALLRRGERAMRRKLPVCLADEPAVEAVRANDVASAILHGERIRRDGLPGVAFATGEEVMDLEHDSRDSAEQRVLAVVGFLSSCGAPTLAVDWLLREMNVCDNENASGLKNPICKDSASALAVIFSLDNLAPYVAACGNIEIALERLCSLYKVYESEDNDESTLSVCTGIEYIAMSYNAFFAPNSGSGNMRWTTWVAQLSSIASRKLTSALLGVLRPFHGMPAKSKETEDFGVSDTTLAALRKSLDERTTIELPANALPCRSSEEADSIWGILPDEDLIFLETIPEKLTPLNALRCAVTSAGCSNEEVRRPALGSWATANSVLGCVVLPEIKNALSGQFLADDQGNRGLVAALELLNDGMHEHDLSGARPTLVLELISLLCAASLLGHGPAHTLLSDLLGRTWVRSALLPRAGSAMAKRLRARVALHVHQTVQPSAISRAVLDSMVALYKNSVYHGTAGGAHSFNEASVISSFGWVEWGVVEMLLAAMVSRRSVENELDDFGSLAGESVSDLRLSEHAELLGDIVSRCLMGDELRRVALGIGNASIRGLAEGLAAMVAHVLHEAAPGGKRVPQSKRMTWSALDRTRCAAMRSILPLLGDEVMETGMSQASPTLNFITGILEQMDSASRLLREPSKDGMLQPDLSPNGSMFSFAVESRFALLRGLIDKLVEVTDDAEDRDTDFATTGATLDIFSRCAIAIAQVIGVSTCLLLPSAISSGILCLFAALERAESSGGGTVMVASDDVDIEAEVHKESESKTKQGKDCSRGEELELSKVVPSSDDECAHDLLEQACKDHVVPIKLRARVHVLLRPAEVWMNAQQRALVRRICGENRLSESDVRIPVRAVKASGEEIDSWYLLEGFGRGADEEPAIPLSAFPRQGLPHGQDLSEWSELEARSVEVSPRVDDRVVRLKRTYSTYACTTVR